MKYNCHNTFDLSKKQISPFTDLVEHLQKVNKKRDYSYNESSINLSFDTALQEKVQKLSQKYKNIKTILLVGIGGSNLGTKAVYEALFYYKRPNVNIIFVDTIDNNYLSTLANNKNQFDPKTTATIVVCKSGQTTETIVNTEILLSVYPNLKDNLIVISKEHTKLYKQAVEKNVDVLEIPEKVGGRFSCFSAVGLLPLQLLGVDTGKLLSGAKIAVLKGLNKNLDENISASSAFYINESIKQGANIINFFTFNKELEYVGKWYRQLVAESLGKQGKGILPTVSVGSTDLHSVVQLYLGGPSNFYTSFLYADKNKYALEQDLPTNQSLHNAVVPSETFFKHLVDNIELKTPNDIRQAIFKGVLNAYQNKNLWFDQYTTPDIDEEFLGEFMQHAMIQIMYLGHLLNVDTFNQPNVEDYKKVTRDLLKEHVTK